MRWLNEVFLKPRQRLIARYFWSFFKHFPARCTLGVTMICDRIVSKKDIYGHPKITMGEGLNIVILWWWFLWSDNDVGAWPRNLVVAIGADIYVQFAGIRGTWEIVLHILVSTLSNRKRCWMWHIWEKYYISCCWACINVCCTCTLTSKREDRGEAEQLLSCGVGNRGHTALSTALTTLKRKKINENRETGSHRNCRNQVRCRIGLDLHC